MDLTTDIRWWRAKRGETYREPHDLAYRWIDLQRPDLQRRRESAKRNAILAGCDLSAFGLGATAPAGCETPRQNILLNASETISAKWSNQRVIPMAVTEGGTYDEQQRAQEFNRGIEALFEQCGVFANDSLWCDDALTWSAAIAKVTCRNGEPIVERAFAFDLVVDPSEARYGWRGVRTLFHLHVMDKLVFLEEYGADLTKEERAKIVAQKAAQEDISLFHLRETSDQIVVAEGWHLPSGPDADDGKYFVGVRGVTVVFDDYDRSTFPVRALYKKKPQIGVWQEPLVQRQAATQAEHDKLTAKIQDAHDLLGKPSVLMAGGHGLKKSDLDDEVGSVYEVTGANVSLANVVKEWNPTPIHPDAYQYHDKQAQNVLQYEGVSEMSARGQVPAGLANASGKALQVYTDEGDGRLVPSFRNREEFMLGIGELLLEALREDGSDYVISVVDGKRLRLVKFSELDIGKDKYRLQVQPASFLSHTASGKFAQLTDMLERGAITPLQYRKMSGIPDILAENELDTAMQDIIDKNIAHILRTGKVVTVLPFDAHELIVERGTKAVNLARVRDEDTAKLDALIQYVQQAHDYQERQKAKAAAAAAAAAPPQMPPGGPMPGPMPPPPMGQPPPAPMPAPNDIPPPMAA